MHKAVLLVIVLIIAVLVFRAWTKDTIDVDIQPPTGKKFKRKTELELPFPQPSQAVRSTREEKCRDIFEFLFQEPFPTKRPSFLKNPETGRNLELDGYCSKLQVAFEYNGRQHYDFPNTFHKTKEDFMKQVARDRHKEQQCRQNGITLISIPYDVPDKGLQKYIMKQLEKEGFVYE